MIRAVLAAYPRQQLPEPLQVEGLRQEVHRPQLHGLDSAVDRRVSGHQHDAASGVDVPDRAQHLDAGDTRHAEVDQYQIHGTSPEVRQHLAAVDRGADLEPLGLCKGADQMKNGAVVVDDQQLRTVHLTGRIG